MGLGRGDPAAHARHDRRVRLGRARVPGAAQRGRGDGDRVRERGAGVAGAAGPLAQGVVPEDAGARGQVAKGVRLRRGRAAYRQAAIGGGGRGVWAAAATDAAAALPGYVAADMEGQV